MSRRSRALAATFFALAAMATTALWFPGLRAAALERLPRDWQLALSAWRHGVRVDHGIRIAMTDGTHLAASLYRPRSADGPLATVLIRVPYGRLRHGEGFGYAIFFAAHGYAALVEDLRGTGESGGSFFPWHRALEDGVATLDWIAAQPWSNGRVGTFGCSALGETQHVLSRANHPAHRAMIAIGAGGGIGTAAGRFSFGGLFEGGVPELASGFGWFVEHGARDPGAAPARAFVLRSHLATLPVATLVERVRPAPNGFREFFTTPLADPKWAEWGYVGQSDAPRVPALVISTWGDQTAGDSLAFAEHLRAGWSGALERQRVVITAGPHCGHEDAVTATRFGGVPITNAGQPWGSLYLAWFDRWLRDQGEGLRAMRPFTVFVVGENRWVGSEAWPPADAAQMRWYLDSDGQANSRAGDGRLATSAPLAEARDRFRYDPADPVPSVGGPACCTGLEGMVAGPADQADVERRDDVLVYTSPPLERPLRIVGPLRAHLVVSSLAPDTDLVVRLAHVRPDGLSLSIQEGALRLRYRDGFGAPAPLAPGQPYAVRVDLRSIAYMVPKGDRLRLHVTGSSFPRLERNMNTGAAINAEETRMAIAETTVLHGPASPSWLELPVFPAE